MERVQDLLSFIEKSPSCYHCVQEVKTRLEKNGFKALVDAHKWELTKGGKYYTIKGDSSIIAFTVGEQLDDLGFHIVASHSDSPSFKIKPQSDYANPKYMKLNTEPYGGMIMSTWLDRPLSIAGRVLMKTDTGVQAKLVDFGEPCCLIPNVCIHMNREINSGYKFNPQVDLLPVLGSKQEGVTFKSLLAKKSDCQEDAILGHDLFLYPTQNPTIWGLEKEYVSAPRLDDLECAYTSLCAFLEADTTPNNINVYACFDNEEVGSGTKQGAASTFLFDTLQRAVTNLGLSQEDYLRAVANGMIISADNAHAVHPNHGELSDANNQCYMNGGITIKHNAAQSYTTDGLSNALFAEICASVNVPIQYFTNRSDLRGGGTLGSISSSQVSIASVDIGLPQLAMHSCYETAGVKDVDYMVEALCKFYRVHIHKENEMQYQIISK